MKNQYVELLIYSDFIMVSREKTFKKSLKHKYIIQLE